MTTSSQLLEGGGDTIAALATAPGRSATALIRISGSRAFEIIRMLTCAPLPAQRVATLRTVYASPRALRESAQVDPGRGVEIRGNTLDRCLVTLFGAPASYTGEDMAELSVHGGVTIPALVLGRVLEAGARQALAGEFTRRAVLNRKLDLLQAEAVGDLIDARSRGAALAAMKHLDGGLTRRILELRSGILDIEALVAYDIDFPEEDDGPIDTSVVAAACDNLLAQLRGLIATAGVGELLREGALVVIAGAPNTGKSSLFNALVGRKRSLVTDTPGTTRDAIEAVLDADEWTIRLVDTAGLRDTREVIERLGIEVSEEYLAVAQAVIVCGDEPELLDAALSRVGQLTRAPLLAVRTKSDLGAQPSPYTEMPASAGAGPLDVSAHTGEGLPELLDGICATLSRSSAVADAGAPLLLRARHLSAVREASHELELFVHAVREKRLPMSVAGTHLHAAELALESLIGTIGIDDVLDRVFSSFCVGK